MTSPAKLDNAWLDQQLAELEAGVLKLKQLRALPQPARELLRIVESTNRELVFRAAMEGKSVNFYQQIKSRIVTGDWPRTAKRTVILRDIADGQDFPYITAKHGVKLRVAEEAYLWSQLVPALQLLGHKVSMPAPLLSLSLPEPRANSIKPTERKVSLTLSQMVRLLTDNRPAELSLYYQLPTSVFQNVRQELLIGRYPQTAQIGRLYELLMDGHAPSEIAVSLGVTLETATQAELVISAYALMKQKGLTPLPFRHWSK